MIIPDESLAEFVEEEGHRCRPGWGAKLLWLLLGTAIGAVAAYFADPDRGRARRTELSQQATSKLGRAQDEAIDSARDATQRTVGKAIDAVPEKEQPSDPVILERIRSEVLGPSDVPTSQLVTTVRDGGVVELRGQVDTPAQRQELIAGVWKVHGVTEVVDLTHLPGEPAPTRS